MSNIKKYCLYTALHSVGLMFCSGAIIQTFLLQAGFSEDQVYILNAIMQAAQAVVMLIMTFLSSKIKRVKLVSALAYSSLSVLVVIFLLCAINPSIFSKGYVIVVFLATGGVYAGVGLYSILSYCLPYYIIDMKEYGKMTAWGVLLSGGISFVLSFVHAFVVSKFDYMKSMIVFFVFAIICFTLTTALCLSLKEIERQAGDVKTSKEDVIAVFKNKDTYILLFPNFARGLATGIMGVITVIATSQNIVNEQTASYINIVMQLAMFVGNILYLFLHGKWSSQMLLLISTIGVAIFFSICINGGLVWFLITFFIAYFFRMIIDTVIPVLVTEIIPERQMGAYTSIRMLTFMGGQVVANLIITPLISEIGNIGLLIFAGVMQLVCGIAYWLVAKKRKIAYST